MVVNSLSFLFFFIVVLVVYYLPAVRKNRAYQNVWLLVCSYFFYGCADVRMIPLLLGSTVFFYLWGGWLKRVMKGERWKLASWISTLGIAVGVGILLYFKYLNFFAESFVQLLAAVGFEVSWTTIHIIVPVGVSFFTFKLIGYIIDIYQETIEPSENFVEFATFVAFFPTILSGPIDRSQVFLPQLGTNRNFNYPLAVDGCRQILWGMFLKMCVADNIVPYTDQAWNSYVDLGGGTLMIRMLLYPIQLYADFSGYSHMAIGVSKILGLKVAQNFNYPFFGRNVAEYWRRWHMSLTQWITDYIYMPLNFAFRKYKSLGTILAILINFIVIGLWHGANWTFVVFGLYFVVLFIPLILNGGINGNDHLASNRLGLPLFKDFLKMSLNFVVITVAMLIFRAPDVTSAFNYLSSILDNPFWMDFELGITKLTLLLIVVVLVVDWIQRNKEHDLQFSETGLFNRWYLRWAVYAALVCSILFFSGEQSNFIYFQF